MANNKKLSKWEPKARRGVYVGLSPAHSSNIPLVMTLKTGYVTLQYHVVFDNYFSMVESGGSDNGTAELWDKNCFLIRIIPSII